MIISVASGKGGTGKTTVAVSLALSVGYCNFMDYDVEAPNSHFFLKPAIRNEQEVTIKHPYFLTETGADFTRCAEFCHYNAVAVAGGKVIFFPELCHGCGGCLLVGPPGAVREKDVVIGRIKKGIVDPGINFFMGELKPGYMRTISIQVALDRLIQEDELVIIDSPPGTSCPMVFSVKDSDFCILVTEPTPYGLNDLLLSIEILESMNVPYGVVINRDGIGNGEVESYCKSKNINILLKIPYEQGIAESYSKGVPLVRHDESWIPVFRSMMEDIKKQISVKKENEEK
ncbi:MAG: ATP-binding protein [Actinobacteria bacterium]|nr:ATP-binding protein [Actinomycetota bacterium]